MTGRTPGGSSRGIGTTTGGGLSTRRVGSGGWWFWGLLLAAVVAIGRCSSHDASTTAPSASTTAADAATGQQALAAAVAEQAPTPIVALSVASVGTGTSRLAKVADEGLSGEMVFSQNCYAVIGAAFAWRKLDECGAFDAAAVTALGDETPVGLDGEVAWFDGEAAAGRYLKAATAAGMDPGVADARLDALRSRVSRRVGRRHGLTADPASTEKPDADSDEPVPSSDDVDGNAVADG